MARLLRNCALIHHILSYELTVGGGEAVRRHWARFIEDTQVLVFVVDSADRRRFSEAYTEMHKLLGEPRLLDIPFLVLANKQVCSLRESNSTSENEMKP